MLDRTVAPPIQEIKALKFPPVNKYQLDNGIPVVEVNQGTQEIIRLEILFDASRTVEDKQIAARMTAAIQKEGTSKHTSAEIAERIDYYGATLSSGSNLDFSYFTIFVLSKYFDETLALLSEVIHDAIFPHDEIVKHKQNQIERLKTNLSKTDLVAYRKVTEEIYGSDHSYGYNSSTKNISALTRADLVNHYNNYHTSDRCRMIVSGKLPIHISTIINKRLGQVKTQSKAKSYIETQAPIVSKRHQIKSDQEHQTAIKIGRRMFNREHEDFPTAFMMNTVLGGYFGSRLMESIREDLGYTYNIYSSLDPLIYDGYMTISTEVSNQLVEPTLDEIYRQMDILKQDLVSEKELKMVKNYVMGNFLNMIDGPFRVAAVMKTLSLSGMTVQEYEALLNQIHHCTAEDIRVQAQKYLQKDTLIEVLVGNQY